jgi:hypothetical protein
MHPPICRGKTEAEHEKKSSTLKKKPKRHVYFKVAFIINMSKLKMEGH